MKKILITGSSGLVGSAIKKVSCNCNYNYSFVYSTSNDCNLENYKETLGYLNKIKPDYVIHLAANVGGLFKNMNNKVGMLEKNLLINFNIVKACYENNINNLILLVYYF